MRGRDRIALLCCALTLLCCAISFGGATRWGALIAAFGSLAAAGCYVTSRQGGTRSALLVLIAIAIGLTAFQLVPLPIGVTHAFSDAKATLVEDNAVAFGAAAPRFAALSFDPPATLLELAKLCGYAAFAFAIGRIAVHRRGKRTLAMLAVGIPLALGAICIGHLIVGATSIYGVFATPVHSHLLGPIINDNHLAAIMSIGVPFALGLAKESVGARRFAWLCAALACVCFALLATSRGGAIGMATGALVTGGLLLGQTRVRAERRAGSPPSRSLIPQIIVGVCVVTIAGVFAATDVLDDFATTSRSELVEPHSKFQVWVHSAGMLEENRYFGVGRGAFEPAYTRFSGVGDVAYSYAENSYLQSVLDWGLIGGTAIVIAASVLVFALMRRWREGPLEAAALGALASIAAHDCADFSMELPVVAMLVIVACAILLPTRLSVFSSTPPHRATRAKLVRVSALIAATAVALIAASPFGRQAHVEPAGADVASAIAVSERHPADFVLLGRVAQLMLDAGDPRAAATISRALGLAPNHVGLHRVAAKLLARSDYPQQALIELGIAIELAPHSLQTYAELLATFPDLDVAVRALPTNPAVSDSVVESLRGRWPALELRYTTRLVQFAPNDPHALELHVRAALRAQRPDLALPSARALVLLRPSSRSTLLLANALGQSGDPAQGLTLVREARTRTGDRGELAALLAVQADLELAANDLVAMARTLDDLGNAVSDAAGRADLHRRRALLDERRGDKNQAQWERDQVRAIEGAQ